MENVPASAEACDAVFRTLGDSARQQATCDADLESLVEEQLSGYLSTYLDQSHLLLSAALENHRLRFPCLSFCLKWLLSEANKRAGNDSTTSSELVMFMQELHLAFLQVIITPFHSIPYRSS